MFCNPPKHLEQNQKIILILFMACVNFFRFKIQKAESRRENVAWSPFAILFAVNVTIKLHYFRITSFPIRDDSETSCQLSFNITKLFHFGTRYSITCFIPVCLQIQITPCVELPYLEMTSFPLLYVNTFLINCCFHHFQSYQKVRKNCRIQNHFFFLTILF